MAARISIRYPRSAKSLHARDASPALLRTFSSTPAPQALGPESPNYIEVPKPVQPTFPPKPIVKGVLPVPRDIFKTRSTLEKSSDEFLEQSTRQPKEERAPGKYTRDAEYILYKRRLAEIRRQSLREGVKQLHVRKTKEEQRLADLSNHKSAFNRTQAMAPPRETDVLTRATVPKTIRDFLEDKLPTPRRGANPQKLAAFEARQARIAAHRQAQLHDLYINAREFIVNVEQLDAAIEKAFGTDEEPVGWDKETGQAAPGAYGKSPWISGPQDGVDEMLERLKRGSDEGITKERMKRVAEELTGGKM